MRHSSSSALCNHGKPRLHVRHLSVCAPVSRERLASPLSRFWSAGTTGSCCKDRVPWPLLGVSGGEGGREGGGEVSAGTRFACGARGVLAPAGDSCARFSARSSSMRSTAVCCGCGVGVRGGGGRAGGCPSHRADYCPVLVSYETVASNTKSKTNRPRQNLPPAQKPKQIFILER